MGVLVGVNVAVAVAVNVEVGVEVEGAVGVAEGLGVRDGVSVCVLVEVAVCGGVAVVGGTITGRLSVFPYTATREPEFRIHPSEPSDRITASQLPSALMPMMSSRSLASIVFTIG